MLEAYRKPYTPVTVVVVQSVYVHIICTVYYLPRVVEAKMKKMGLLVLARAMTTAEDFLVPLHVHTRGKKKPHQRPHMQRQHYSSL